MYDVGVLRGIVRNTGTAWAEQRRFTMQTLKNLAFIEGDLESIISQEASALCNYLKNKSGEDINNVKSDLLLLLTIIYLSIFLLYKLMHDFFREIFYPASFNVIWRLVASERFDWEDRRLKKIMKCLDIVETQRVRTV